MTTVRVLELDFNDSGEVVSAWLEVEEGELSVGEHLEAPEWPRMVVRTVR